MRDNAIAFSGAARIGSRRENVSNVKAGSGFGLQEI